MSHVRALAIDPSTPGTVYAGTDGWGVFKSIDWGTSWNASGLTDGLALAFAIDPSNHNTIYAGTDGGVLKSTNGVGFYRLRTTDLEVEQRNGKDRRTGKPELPEQNGSCVDWWSNFNNQGKTGRNAS